MEDIKTQERPIFIEMNVFGQGNIQSQNGKKDRYGSIRGMKKTKAGHRPDGKGYSQRMGGMFEVEHAGITQKMQVNKSKKKKQDES
jgi:hypothetical protein